MKIRIVRTESHDWVSITLNDTLIHQGHSIPDFVWVLILGAVAPSVVVEEDERPDE